MFKMLLEGTPKLEGREVEVSWGHIGMHRPPCLEFVDKRGVREESQAGGHECLGDCVPSLPSLTLFPFLPGSSAPSLAALRDMTVSTSTPPQTSLSALKSSGT